VEPKIKGCFESKADRTETGFLAEPLYFGQRSPRFYDKKHSLVEKRVVTKTFYKPINEKLDKIPVFLRERKATQLISPASHNPLDSLKSAVLPKPRFAMRRGSPKSHIDYEM